MRMPVDGPGIASEFVLPFEVCAHCVRQIYGVGILGIDETDESIRSCARNRRPDACRDAKMVYLFKREL